ncbi:methyltransferase domain-containing protein [Streptomyces sp. NPDC048442]|uniref:methyltransferase domain-containing protein n=1 Tax=Streptomyces sp. NPDC048442 TaxID=3154823 RepID=UPI0034306720
MGELERALVSAGVLSPDWAPAFEAVPRSAFLPELIWPWDMATGRSIPVSRAEQPGPWQAYAGADVPIVTQWDDGRHGGREPGEVATSSASMPSVVFRMLQYLGVRRGDRVLEIGTGTGWNAALLAHRLGAANVVSVEVDQEVAEVARGTLGRFGMPVRVVCGDGAEGDPDGSGAGYDRVVATVGVRSVPWAWVRQTLPGGVVVAPWGVNYANGDAVVRLVVADDGASASGPFMGPVEFMKLRAQRQPAVVHDEFVGGGVTDGDESGSDLPRELAVLSAQFDPWAFVLGVRVPHFLRTVDRADEEGNQAVWWYGTEGSRSWACVQFRRGRSARVWQYGPRRLWDEVESAYAWWEGAGRPGHERFGLTVTSEGERVWLDDPSGGWAALP